MMQRKIAFIGGGNMAAAIISGLIASGYEKSLITVSAPSEATRTRFSDQIGVLATADNVDAASKADVVVLAVKPQLMREVCEGLKGISNIDQKLFLTIAAGTAVQLYRDILSPNLKIIRIMPNTPSLVGEGVSGLFADDAITVQDKSFTTDLMSAVGKVVWVDKESEINHVIAIAGSAPGYLFLFLEAMQDKAMALGFDSAQARELILQTAKGVVALAQHEQDLGFNQLRANVTSKGGTTFEALNVFDKNGLKATVDEAMQAAIDRAQSMETEFSKAKKS
ncbi:pyrroline-5-carboxylate reductase [Acinetobacter boissieri]|uniref:Pyrroline-5-carboxylate reductase n=1 Tax=Acinetobacter boissieri TaxID=1219383 RepID=A0A1G6GVQ5_9GAMM|nr:pyrroline-5-carboxylate reductase [Acinetobacter boissieri]SDB85765.1 pyrroline-5-carboxylate reductase [Acinetobacter boissieri]